LFKRFCLSREDQDEHRSDQLSWRDSAYADNVVKLANSYW